MSQAAQGSSSSFFSRLKDSQPALIIGIGGALAAIVAFGIYSHLSGKKAQPTSGDEKIEQYLAEETMRLRDPELTEEGAMLKEDFFDLIFLIKLKTAGKLNKEVGKRQR
jgi:hypothetical protein